MNQQLECCSHRDGIRREKDTSGYGSIAMDVNDDKVAPWCVGECSGNAVNKLDVYNAQDWAVSRNNDGTIAESFFAVVVAKDIVQFC